MWITFIVLAVVVFGFALLLMIAKRKMGSIASVPDNPKVITLTDQNFSNKIKSGMVLVDFWAAWCGPCKMMGPVLNELAEETDGKVTIGKVNVDEERATSSRFSIRSIPTMILFRNGKEIHRFSGYKSKDYLLKELDRRAIY
jgi:thioredoxin 1